MATATRAPLIRRMRDADGQLVTYLPARELTALIGISASAIHCWAKQGLLRYTDRLNGSRNYAVVDAVKLKLLTPKEAAALGIQKTPSAYLARNREWYEAEQQATRPRAAQHGEEWDEYDCQYLIDNVAAGHSIDIMAKALGRTYAATSNQIERLRRDGEIPMTERDEREWKIRVFSVLTPTEIAMVVTRGAVAA